MSYTFQPNRCWLAIVLAAALLTTVGSAYADTLPFLVNFDDVPVGTTTPFDITQNGTTLHFVGSVSGFAGFVVTPTSSLQTLTGNVLADGLLPFSPPQQTLAIGFTSPQTFISLIFATEEFGTTSPFTLAAFSSGSLIGTTTAFGSVPSGGTFPEGRLTFSSSAFDTVVLQSDAPYFAIDNITNVPEPNSALLLASGLGILGVAIRRSIFVGKLERRGL